MERPSQAMVMFASSEKSPLVKLTRVSSLRDAAVIDVRSEMPTHGPQVADAALNRGTIAMFPAEEREARPSEYDQGTAVRGGVEMLLWRNVPEESST